MNRLAIYLSGLSLALLLVSCAPRPVYRMKPQADNTTFNQGTEYVHFQENGIELTISYYKHMNKRFVMDVEIANRSDSVIRIDPTQFSYKAFGNMNSNYPDESDEVIASRRAIDPEQELVKKDMAIARSIANQKTSTVLEAVTQAAYVGSSITADSDLEREEIEEDSDRSYYYYRMNQYDREMQRAGLRDQREIWEIDALRKTDLFPGEYIRGFLFFKNESDALAYFIDYDSEKASFRVCYQQWKYDDF